MTGSNVPSTVLPCKLISLLLMLVTSTLTVHDLSGLTHNTVSGILNPSGHGAASLGSNITGVLLSSPPVFAWQDTLTDFPLGIKISFLLLFKEQISEGS